MGFRRTAVLMVMDIALVNLGVALALYLRFDGTVPGRYSLAYLEQSVFYAAACLMAFWWNGLYSRLWRYADTRDIIRVVKGVVAAMLGFVTIGLLSGHLLPRSIYPLSGILNVAFVALPRYLGNVFDEARAARRGQRVATNGQSQKVLIYGAGDAGAMVCHEMGKHSELGTVVGFIDDDPAKQGMYCHGVRVLGSFARLKEIIYETKAKQVILAIASAPRSLLRDITAVAQEAGARVKTIPGVYEIIGGQVSLKQIRDVDIEDLLGRDPVRLDLDSISGYLEGKRVLVTGAAGSIGSELCRQISRFNPARLIALDNNETGLYDLSFELRAAFPEVDHGVVVASVRDVRRLDSIFERLRPEVVFHAAAHKHVPLMEDNPGEAVKTNVFGTFKVAKTAAKYGVEKFVLISTDKAVNPSSLMGATKRVAEMILAAMNVDGGAGEGAGRTAFVTVRFGNVLGSRGSVIPLFKAQIARGGPVTVTHPDMTRFFMTIPEAVQLVLQASAMGVGGDLFVLDMGEQVRILDLAETMIRLSGYRPGVDIEIEITGPRPGEKMYEELLTLEEGAVATQHARIMRVPAATHVAIASWAPETLWRDLMALARAASQDEYGRIARAVGRIVPEFQPAAAGESALAEVAAAVATGDAGRAAVPGASGASAVSGTALATDHSGEGTV